MQNQTPVTDYKKTTGLIYFARMLDKIRLHAAGILASGYFVGVEDPTFFDSRCTRFLGVDYDELTKRTLAGGSDEEMLRWSLGSSIYPYTTLFQAHPSIERVSWVFSCRD